MSIHVPTPQLSFSLTLRPVSPGPSCGEGRVGRPRWRVQSGGTLSSAGGGNSVSLWPAQEATGVCSAAGLTTCLWCGF